MSQVAALALLLIGLALVVTAPSVARRRRSRGFVVAVVVTAAANVATLTVAGRDWVRLTSLATAISLVGAVQLWAARQREQGRRGRAGAEGLTLLPAPRRLHP